MQRKDLCLLLFAFQFLLLALILYTLDASLPVGTRKAGRKKRTGYVVDTYKVYKDASGNVTEKKKLWTTTYRAMQDEILYNDGSGAASNE